MKTFTDCQECGARISGDGIGHAADCSRCTDDGSELVAKKWLESRPQAIRDAIAKYPLSHLWLMKSTGQRVFIISFFENEDGSVTECKVGFRQKLNPQKLVLVDRDIFGVPLADLQDLGEYKK